MYPTQSFVIISRRYCSFQMLRDAHGAISYLEYGSSVCIDDNPIAKAREISSRTHGQTIL